MSDPRLLTSDELAEIQEAVCALACPYHRGTGTCNQGCSQEPACTVDTPTGGWERQVRADALLAHIDALAAERDALRARIDDLRKWAEDGLNEIRNAELYAQEIVGIPWNREERALADREARTLLALIARLGEDKTNE